MKAVVLLRTGKVEVTVTLEPAGAVDRAVERARSLGMSRGLEPVLHKVLNDQTPFDAANPEHVWIVQSILRGDGTKGATSAVSRAVRQVVVTGSSVTLDLVVLRLSLRQSAAGVFITGRFADLNGAAVPMRHLAGLHLTLGAGCMVWHTVDLGEETIRIPTRRTFAYDDPDGRREFSAALWESRLFQLYLSTTNR